MKVEIRPENNTESMEIKEEEFKPTLQQLTTEDKLEKFKNWILERIRNNYHEFEIAKSMFTKKAFESYFLPALDTLIQDEIITFDRRKNRYIITADIQDETEIIPIIPDEEPQETSPSLPEAIQSEATESLLRKLPPKESYCVIIITPEGKDRIEFKSLSEAIEYTQRHTPTNFYIIPF